MLTAEQNKLLTQTGAGTPMGELMRRYWIPITISNRVVAGGAPLRIKILGEELVVFRSPQGEVGLMAEMCPHRNASLALARNEECGLRCLYHAWLIAPDGRVLETPPEPPEVNLSDKFKHPAYPCCEAGGIVWAYLGPEGTMPDFPEWIFQPYDDDKIYATNAFQDCNWLQGLEGDLDAQHGPYLHYTDDEAHTQDGLENRANEYIFDQRPKVAAARRPWGLQTVFRYLHKDGKAATYWIHPFVMPFFTFFESNLLDTEGALMHAWVPATDESHWVWSVLFSESAMTDDYLEFVDRTRGYGMTDPENNWRVTAFTGEGVGYEQDRELMASGKSFSGIEGILQQDLAIQYSMGPISDRTREHLTSGDIAIVQVRKYLLDTLTAVANGEPAPGTKPGSQEGILFEALTAEPDASMRDLAAR
ncbi:Rieske 2Fe-2S domain-containing protein [Saccharopolyspora pogona]|uniref:Rieske 2Fe-2S domain-containing protein n=1 Tax=Saccharopolyspora pogona TaxID=333966 RepID=UPI0016883F2C|nr:Rieske 2Fe-2S domain-containing protein [Saccharopolyspora pogona]